MATNISKTVNVNDLPVEQDVNSEDHIIVQNDIKTYRIKFKDLIFNKENTTFGQEINELYSRVNDLNTMVIELQNKLQQETARATAAETALRNLSTTNRTNVESTLNTTINNESSRAQTKESSLQSQINQVKQDLKSEISRSKTTEASLRSEIEAYRHSHQVPL